MLSRRQFIQTTLAGAVVAGARPLGIEAQSTGAPKSDVIDMHVHVLRKLRSPFIYRDNPLVSHWTWHEHSGDLLVQEMNIAGVDRALLKTFNGIDIAYALNEDFGGKPEDFDSSEEYMLKYRDQYPNRFIWMATVNPTIPNFREVWTKKFGNHLKAVCLFPGLQDHRLDDPNVSWLLDECVKRGIKGIMYSPENTSRTNKSADYIKQLTAMIDRYSQLHFCLMHGGYQVPHSLERGPTLALVKNFNDKYGNVWVETSTQYMDTKYPFPVHLKGTKDLFDNIGPDRMLWATDWPWVETIGKYSQFKQTVEENCSYMTPAQKAKYLGGNAREFLVLPSSARSSRV